MSRGGRSTIFSRRRARSPDLLLLHLLGLDVPPSRWYDFWSGMGSDLGELAILGAVWHHLNCHQERCWRIARHRHDGYCRRHRKDTA